MDPFAAVYFGATVAAVGTLTYACHKIENLKGQVDDLFTQKVESLERANRLVKEIDDMQTDRAAEQQFFDSILEQCQSQLDRFYADEGEGLETSGIEAEALPELIKGVVNAVKNCDDELKSTYESNCDLIEKNQKLGRRVEELQKERDFLYNSLPASGWGKQVAKNLPNPSPEEFLNTEYHFTADQIEALNKARDYLSQF